MRIAVLSDIHSNLEALQEVLFDIQKQKIDQVISLGDAVGYGPNPNEVIQLLLQSNIPSVIGNHELAVLDPAALDFFNPVARIAIEKNIQMLTPAALDYIRSCKRHLCFHGLRFVHGFPPDDPKTYLFQVSDQKMLSILDDLDESIVFIGHTHELRMIRIDDRRVEKQPLAEGSSTLSPESKYILNIGSVGQPRDGNNHAKYAVLDTGANKLEIRFVPYDYSTTAEKILQAGIPKMYANRLKP